MEGVYINMSDSIVQRQCFSCFLYENPTLQLDPLLVLLHCPLSRGWHWQFIKMINSEIRKQLSYTNCYKWSKLLYPWSAMQLDTKLLVKSLTVMLNLQHKQIKCNSPLSMVSPMKGVTAKYWDFLTHLTALLDFLSNHPKFPMKIALSNPL